MLLSLEDADYFVRVLPFPVHIPAFVRMNSDGTYSMYFNSDFDFEHWLNSYEHELLHIIHDDLYGAKNIKAIENLN